MKWSGLRLTLRNLHGGTEIAYNDLLRVGWSGDRIPMVARFSASVQTGPGPHPTSYKLGTGSFSAVTRPIDVNHTPPSSAEIKERVNVYL
jgi:hypothetical protein